MRQEMYYDQEIFPVIKAELEKATEEILVVMAWFTDEDLFGVLETKLDEGIKVGIVVSDNEDNQKLDFGTLISKGAVLNRVERVGYGIMHMKFCVIDNSICIQGSYNWSMNARKNNGENILLTDDQNIITSLREKYSGFINGNYKKNNLVDIERNTENPVVETNISPFHGIKEDLSTLLDAYLSDLVKPFDQESLKEKGYKRSMENSGDITIVSGLMDSVYDDYLRDIDINDSKKESLKGKIEDQKTRSSNLLKERFITEKGTIEKEQEIIVASLNRAIGESEKEIEQNKLEIEKIETVSILAVEKEMKQNQAIIVERKKEFVKPKHKWYELVPWIIITLALMGYLLLFYSSAAYILLYSEQDAQMAELKNQPIMPPEVYNGDALTMAYEKGFANLAIILLFTVIPFSAALLEKFWEGSKTIKWTIFLLGIVVLDGFIAYKVASSIHNIDYLRGAVEEKWQFSMVFSQINFWIVFVLGSVGFLFFGMSYNRLINYFQERHPNAAEAKMELEVQELRRQNLENDRKVDECKNQIFDLKKIILDFNFKIDSKRIELNQIPVTCQQRLSQLETKLQAEIHSIESLASLYMIKVENEEIKIASEPLKHRVDCAMSGWSEFLYSEYSQSKASQRLALANIELSNWYDNKLKKLS